MEARPSGDGDAVFGRAGVAAGGDTAASCSWLSPWLEVSTGAWNGVKLKSEGDKLYGVHYSWNIIPTDVCEINNNHSLVKEIIEHILKARYQQKQSGGDGRYQYNENKLAPQSD